MRTRALTVETAADVVRLTNAGVSGKDIAALLGVSQPTISRYLRHGWHPPRQYVPVPKADGGTKPCPRCQAPVISTSRVMCVSCRRSVRRICSGAIAID